MAFPKFDSHHKWLLGLVGAFVVYTSVQYLSALEAGAKMVPGQASEIRELSRRIDKVEKLLAIMLWRDGYRTPEIEAVVKEAELDGTDTKGIRGPRVRSKGEGVLGVEESRHPSSGGPNLRQATPEVP